MLQVKEDRTTNDEIRSGFNAMAKPEEIWRNRQLLFLGSIARMDKKSCPRTLLSAMCEGRRNMGTLFRTARDSFVDSLRLIIEDVDHRGNLSDWIECALEK